MDSDSDSEVDLSSLEKKMVARQTNKTKRQKGDVGDLVQLPDKRPRKDAKKLDEASEIIRR